MCADMSSRRSYAGVKSKWMAQYGTKPGPKKRSWKSKRVALASIPAKYGLELKFLDQAITNTAVPSPAAATGGEMDPAASVNCVGHPAQGDGPSDRDGRTYVVKSLDIKGIISVPAQANQTAGDVAGDLVVFLVQDTQTNGAQLNSEDVFTNISADALTATQCVRNLFFAKRFRVLDSCRMNFEQPEMVYDGTNVEQGGYVRPFELKWHGNVKVIATSTAGTVATVSDNSFHVIAFCSNAALAPAMYYNARTRFMG